MSRSLASHLAVLIIGLTLGVGAVAVAERGTATQRPTSGEKTIAKELRKLQNQIGTSQYDSKLREVGQPSDSRRASSSAATSASRSASSSRSTNPTKRRVGGSGVASAFSPQGGRRQ